MSFLSKGTGELIAVYPGEPGRDYTKITEGDQGRPYINGVCNYTYLKPGEYTAVTIATSYGNWSEKSVTTNTSRKVVVVDKKSDISSLTIPQINGKSTIEGNTISIPIPASIYNTAKIYTIFTLNSDLAKLVFNGVVVNSGDSLDFSSVPTIAVRPNNGPDKVYNVTLVSTPVSTAKSFIYYGIKAAKNVLKTEGVIDEANKTISLIIPFGTKVVNPTSAELLVHEFIVSTDAKVFIGSVQQKTGVIPKINLTNPITYTVQALDLSTQNYVVTATLDQALKSFKIPSLEKNPMTFDYAAGTIVIKVFAGTVVNALVAEMTGIENSNVTFGASNTAFVNGVTAIDFTSPVVFTITGKGDNTQIKTITVSVVEV